MASALVAGAIAPDLLYIDPLYRFATQEIHGNLTLTLTHKFSSVFWLDPLLALLLLAVFNLIVRRPLLALGWSGLAARLPSPADPIRLPSLITLAWTAISAVIGAFTNVLWDSFTHDDGYFVQHYKELFTANVTAAWDVNRVLQYVSSIGGCLIIAFWLYRWYRRTELRTVSTDPYTAQEDAQPMYVPAIVRYVVLAAMVLMGLAGAVVQLNRADAELVGETAARLALTGLASGGLAALGWYVAIWHVARLRRLGRGVARL